MTRLAGGGRFEALLEVMHGEGGDDAKLWTAELARAYILYLTGRGLKAELLTDEPGHKVLLVKGRGVFEALEGEAGSHCVQRESGDKRHTSFCTVAVLPLPPEESLTPLPERELSVTFQTGKQKAGGQNVNRIKSAVRMRHVPTGLSVFINGRDQHSNRREALRILTAKVNRLRSGDQQAIYSSLKSSQMMDRGRGGKIRTYNFLQSRVTDHRTGKVADTKSVMKGRFELVR